MWSVFAPIQGKQRAEAVACFMKHKVRAGFSKRNRSCTFNNAAFFSLYPRALFFSLHTFVGYLCIASIIRPYTYCAFQLTGLTSSLHVWYWFSCAILGLSSTKMHHFRERTLLITVVWSRHIELIKNTIRRIQHTHGCRGLTSLMISSSFWIMHRLDS